MRTWSEKCDTSFEDLKKSITDAPVLIPPDWKIHFRLHVHASQYALGGTPSQKKYVFGEQVVAYTSRKLNDAEQSYSANERNYLGSCMDLKVFAVTLKELIRSFDG